MTKAIEFRNVSKRHGPVTAVDNISFTIESGKFVSIIGTSGSGKTSTLRLIAGLEQATDGQITVNGRDMRDVMAWQSNAPLVWQNFALFPHLNVEENVGYGLRIRGVKPAERKQRVQRMLETVGLGGYGTRPVTALSGGQMQRVGLARALVLKPKLLLLDEPLGALDPPTARQMQEELKRLHAEFGITFVYVTHNQNEAMALSDEVIVMGGGRIHQIAPPRELDSKPRNRFVAGFVGDNNIIDGTLVSVSGPTARVETEMGSFSASVHPSDKPSPKAAVAISVPSHEISVSQARSDKASIEGRVSSVEYNGAIVKVKIATSKGRQCSATLNRSEFEQDRLAEGQPAWFGWNEDQSSLVL